jgi:hypothetical protein
MAEIENPADELVSEKSASGDKLTTRIAITTVLLAIVAVIFSHIGDELGGDGEELRYAAQLTKNDANKNRIEAANRWAYFQAKSTKQSLAENVIALSSDEGVKAKFKDKVDRYEKEKIEITKEARGFEQQAAAQEAKVQAYDAQAELLKGPEDQIKRGMPLVQIGIALASITILTRKKWMLAIAVFCAAVGLLFSIWGFYQLEQLPDLVAQTTQTPTASAPASP